MSPLGWFKLIAIFAVFAAIGYEQYWVFDQGRQVGMSKCVAEALRQAKLEDEANLRLRQTEREEAASVANRQIASGQKKIKDLQTLNESLKNVVCANESVPESVIGLLNSQRTIVQ